METYQTSDAGNLQLNVTEIEGRFGYLCKSVLLLDDQTTEEAMTLLRESKNDLLAHISSIGSGSPGEVESYWFACILYVVKKLGGPTKFNKEQGVYGLCQILKATSLNLVDFCKEIPQFTLKIGHILSKLYGLDWEKRVEVNELQANFVHLSILSKHYRRAYMQFFHSSDSEMAICESDVFDFYRFGWMLFLSLRVHAFSRFKDLVTCTNGLIAILVILILHIPVRFRKFSLDESDLFVRKADARVDIIASLSSHYRTCEEELRNTMEMANNLIADILKKKPVTASECKMDTLQNIITDGLAYFDGLLEKNSLASSLITLEKDYEDAVRNKGELDERLFVNEEESVLGSGSLSGGAVNKRKFEVFSSPSKTVGSPTSALQSPITSPAVAGAAKRLPQTPVSTAMSTAKWLRNFICPLSSKPSPQLKQYFSTCDKDVTDSIIHRAHIILGAIFPSDHEVQGSSGRLRSVNQMDSAWTEQRKLESLKLYYKVLEAMCKAELRVIHSSNLSLLLCNERFHRCMLACSAELVLATHKTSSMLFPAVLERTGITAFDLSKVIESFVRHEESLPRELKRHLNCLEEKLLESMAWEKGSSLYNSLVVARPNLTAEITRLGLLAEPMPSLDEIVMHHNVSNTFLPLLLHSGKLDALSDQNGDACSPKRAYIDHRTSLTENNSATPPAKECASSFATPKSKIVRPLQAAFASPSHPNPSGGETCAETAIQIFFSKIVKLAAIRIKCLWDSLGLSHQILEAVYYLVQQILAHQTRIFFNRHIDQIILCSFYGVAKVSGLSLTFKGIICNYRKQPQCKYHVYRSVFVDKESSSHTRRTGQDHVDIITFYNEVFVPVVKPLLEELRSSTAPLKLRKLPEDCSSQDGPCPQSPRLAPFPNLPDMSPKKVSAKHNVYVSPLRSSKMDVLISPNSKSSYACVGESTHAYQSPSKDLSDINNRLNSRNIAGHYTTARRVNLKLNFDAGLVSDSMVACSLYPQRASTTPSATSTSVKCEHDL